MWRLLDCFRRFLRHRRKLTLGILCVPLTSLGDIAITKWIGDALDKLQAGVDAGFLRTLFFLLMATALVRGVFRFLQRWWIVSVSRYVECELKQDLFDRLISLSAGFHAQSRSGDLVSRLTSDVENVRMFLGPGLMYTVGAVVMLPVSLGYLLLLDTPLALWMLLPLCAMGLGVRVLTPRLHRLSTNVQESLAEISQRAQENFAGIRVVKGYGRGRAQVARFDGSSRKAKECQIALARARGVMHMLTWGAKDFTFLPILVVGGLAMMRGELPHGDLFKFIDLTFKVFWPIIAVGWMAGMFPRALASAERIGELLDRVPEIRDPEKPRTLARVKGEIRLDGVSFSYPGSDRRAVQDVSLEVAAGSVLGIVGPTGSGKSTLLGLIARFFEAEGLIQLDGVPIRELSLTRLRGAIGYVPQDSLLFSEPYRDNIAFGADGELSDAEVQRLVELVRMDEEVSRFPGGLRQEIGERGVTLSGGQRQRSCIARALAKNPRILILDDSLSSVDSETERELVQNLRQAGAGRTVLIAAHRLSTVRHADQIVVLNEGRVEALGTHAELARRPGWYRQTWERQETQQELLSL